MRAAPASACLIDGRTVPDGGSGVFFFASQDASCASESRVCANGVLSGSATYPTCRFPPGASVVTFGFDALAGANGSCAPTALHGAACASAFSRACAASGFATGFGPLEVGPDSAQAACLGAAMVTGATVPFSTLQVYQPGCAAANPAGDACNSAVNRYCAAHGFAGGLNITEYSGANATLNCLTGAGATSYGAAWGELHVAHHGCSATGDHASCSTAVARYCQSLGAGFVAGFGIQEYQLLSTTVACLSPTAPAPTGAALDPLAYFAPERSNSKRGDMPLSQVVDY